MPPPPRKITAELSFCVAKLRKYSTRLLRNLLCELADLPEICRRGGWLVRGEKNGGLTYSPFANSV